MDVTWGSDAGDVVATQLNKNGVPRKRNRVPVACVPCRSRKLKCDLTQPCESCMKRKDGVVCVYDSPLLATTTVSKRRGGKSKKSSEDRLKALEEFVTHMAGATSPPAHFSGAVSEGTGQERGYLRRGSSHDGCLTLVNSESSYVGSTHWSTILHDIQDLKNVIIAEEPGTPRDDAPSTACARLFSSASPLVTIEQVLDMLPGKVQVDRYLSTYFKARFIVSPTIHRYQFQRQYEQFWVDPTQASPLWVSILFSILCISALLQDYDEAHTQMVGPLTRYFSEASAQCLILGDYTHPGKHCIEALLMFCQCISLSSLDSPPELALVFSIVVRLAFRSGYHRDPSAFSTISVFDGEMRRRTWALCKNYDLVIAFSPGLPSNIPINCYDTRPPLNLQDEDFNETSASLPPSRSEIEPTRILYIVTKDRLMTVFSRILHSSLSFLPADESPPTLSTLDTLIRSAHASIPACLTLRPFAQSFADSADVIMSRIVLEIITQKLLCTLYRRPMCRGGYFRPRDLRHRRSRDTDAAGRPTPTIVSDFTLAIMVLGLGLSQDQDQGGPQRECRVGLLSQSLAICEDLGWKSWEAHRAAGALREMLKALQPQSTGNGADLQAQTQLAEMASTEEDGLWPTAGGEKAQYMAGNVDWTFLDQYMYDANGAMPLTGLEGIWRNTTHREQ